MFALSDTGGGIGEVEKMTMVGKERRIEEEGEGSVEEWTHRRSLCCRNAGGGGLSAGIDKGSGGFALTSLPHMSTYLDTSADKRHMLSRCESCFENGRFGRTGFELQSFDGSHVEQSFDVADLPGSTSYNRQLTETTNNNDDDDDDDDDDDGEVRLGSFECYGGCGTQALGVFKSNHVQVIVERIE